MILSFSLDLFPYLAGSNEIDPSRIRNFPVKDEAEAYQILALHREKSPLSIWNPQLFTDGGELIKHL